MSQCMRDMAAADEALAQSIYCLYGLSLGVDGMDQHNVDTKAKLTTCVYSLSLLIVKCAGDSCSSMGVVWMSVLWQSLLLFIN